MKSDELWQVRIPPADYTEELYAAVREAVERGEPLRYSKRAMARVLLVTLLHPFGIHHWVNYRTFDPGSNRIIVHPGHWVCAKCPALRRT